MSPESLLRALQQLLDRPPEPRPWRDGTKIPWHDAEFSERVLAVHLDPETNMASRSPDVVRDHVDWLLALLSAEPTPPDDRPRHVLDLGCGPGLYALALARAGLQVTGIDFAPAAVRHARQQAHAAGRDDRVTIIEADLADLGPDLLAGQPPVDVVTFWFAEFHGFAPPQARRLLAAAAATLAPGGLLVLEHMPWEMFVQQPETSWDALERSVFADTPHLWLQEHRWDDDQRAEITVHWILDAATGRLDRFAQCHQAYTDEELTTMLVEAGFTAPRLHPPITGVDAQLEFPMAVARRRHH